jgi:hypothetical protein
VGDEYCSVVFGNLDLGLSNGLCSNVEIHETHTFPVRDMSYDLAYIVKGIRG